MNGSVLSTPHISDETQALTQRIKTQALSLGFDLVGVAPAQESPELVFFPHWLDAGYAGEMQYLVRSRERRSDVQRVLPGVQSIVVCGLNYDTAYPYSTTQTDPERGLVARYAWGADYHEVMQTRLAALQDYVATLVPPPVASKLYVDTGPVVERVYAKYAGLGWFGKNTCLLNTRLGSWLLLGELLLTIPLIYDQPAHEHCGTCTRCLDACPTQAFIAPYVLDARRCIAYLTIEYKGVIPDEFRVPIGQHIFGCDICQDVCPWNRKRHMTTLPEFQPRAAQQHPSLAELATLTPAEFRQRFRGTPMERSKRRGLVRNVCVAMGNAGNTAFIPLLESLLDDEEPLIRTHAAWALTQLRRSTPALSSDS
jgi:epoxyqueuosine reductase